MEEEIKEKKDRSDYFRAVPEDFVFIRKEKKE